MLAYDGFKLVKTTDISYFLSENGVVRACTNTSQPDLVTLTKVAALLDVDVRQLINKTKGNNADD